MENLELQTQIINLGKLLVTELGLDTSTDTLSRWMAHYVSEKITLSESLPSGSEKQIVEKECFELILKLWKHRWTLPFGKRPLENFEPILKVLERLNTENPDPFFYRYHNPYLAEIDNDEGDSNEINDFVNKVLEIDRVARILIESLLQQAALKVKNEKIEMFLNNAINLTDNEDIRAIQMVYENDDSITSQNYNEGTLEKNYKIEKLKKRIEELENFTTVKELLLGIYKNDLNKFENNL